MLMDAETRMAARRTEVSPLMKRMIEGSESL